jgi:CHAT domain-containing protein
MKFHRVFTAAAISLGLVACNEAPDQTAFDPSDTPSLCKQVRSLSLTAQRDSFSFSFAQADQKFARLISLYDTQDVITRCPGAPSKAFLLASQGLALSNQEQFRLAQAAFDNAQASLDAQATPRPDEALLLKNFRVQDALNRGAREETALAFQELGSLLQDDGTATLSTFENDDLFAPDDAAVRRLVGVASSEYVRSISLASNVDKNLSKAVRLAEAEAAIDRAINLIGTVPSASAAYLPRFLIQKAVVQLEIGQPARARVNAAQAAQSLNELLPGTPLGARALLVQAKAEADDNDRAAALETYAQGFSVYEENPVPIRSESVWPFFRLALEERRRDPSQATALNAAMFRAAQIVRSSVAAKTISGAAALFSEGDSDAARAVRNWQAANDNYGLLKAAQIQAQFDSLAAPDAQKNLAREVSRAEDALASALADRDRLAPAYRATLDAPIALADVQSVLQSGEAMVQILTGEPRNVIFLVEADSIEVFAVPVTEGIAEEVVTILRGFVEAEPSGEFREFAADAAHLAYQLLLGEAGPRLKSYDRLIFSVSGPMASLPLEMLVVDEPDTAESAAWRNGDYREIAWLGSQSDISYVPSPRNLVDIRARAGKSAATKPVLAFGDFQPGANVDSFLTRYDLDDTCRSDAGAVAGLEALPETATEARMIAASLGTPDAVRLGADFTKERIQADRNSLADYRIVHFATHGLLWPTPDCFSEPALAVSVSGGSGDPLLTARDIRGLELDAQLVVLSACETAGPTDRSEIGAGGDSLSGLARAFFAAGARAVMASHWSVFSEQTQDLTVAMYDEIGGNNATFSQALRSAQAKLRNDPKTSHPIYWAAFVVIGDGALALN